MINLPVRLGWRNTTLRFCRLGQLGAAYLTRRDAMLFCIFPYDDPLARRREILSRTRTGGASHNPWTIMNEDRCAACYHIVRVEGAHGEVVRGAVLMEVAHPADDDRRAVRLTEFRARGEVAGVGPAVVGGVPEGVVPGWGLPRYVDIYELCSQIQAT
jgi:hypothetical protein